MSRCQLERAVSAGSESAAKALQNALLLQRSAFRRVAPLTMDAATMSAAISQLNKIRRKTGRRAQSGIEMRKRTTVSGETTST